MSRTKIQNCQMQLGRIISRNTGMIDITESEYYYDEDSLENSSVGYMSRSGGNNRLWMNGNNVSSRSSGGIGGGCSCNSGYSQNTG